MSLDEEYWPCAVRPVTSTEPSSAPVSAVMNASKVMKFCQPGDLIGADSEIVGRIEVQRECFLAQGLAARSNPLCSQAAPSWCFRSTFAVRPTRAPLGRLEMCPWTPWRSMSLHLRTTPRGPSCRPIPTVRWTSLARKRYRCTGGFTLLYPPRLGRSAFITGR